MLSLAPSLRICPALECPVCGQILKESFKVKESLYCPECGYSVGIKSEAARTTTLPYFT